MKRLIPAVVSVVALVAAVTLVWTNYYGAVAVVREGFATADISEAYAHGELLFETRGCVFCHTLDRAGSVGDSGPDLSDIGERASLDDIRQSIAEPNAVIAANCPEEACEPGIMPPYGSVLNDAQIEALAVYVAGGQ